MDAPTDYTSAWHFRDSLERQHFSRQVAAYLTVLADRFASLAERAKSEELPPHTIIGQYEEAHLSFRMRFWILESIADLVRRGELPLSEGVVHVQHAIAAALCLFSQRSEPTLLRLQASRKKVCQGFPGRDHQIAIAYDPEPPDLSVADDYGWWRRFYDAERGPVVGVRWDQIETAADPVPKAAAAVAAKSSARAQVPTIRLTRSQQRCAEVLRSYWLALHEASTAGGYGQRPPLIAAQSGSGKTRLVRWMAESHACAAADFGRGRLAARRQPQRETDTCSAPGVASAT
jgi:hypothetical protein